MAAGIALAVWLAPQIARAQNGEDTDHGFHVSWSDAREPHRASAERELAELHLALRTLLSNRAQLDGISRALATDTRLRDLYERLRGVTERAPSLAVAWLDLADIDFEFRDGRAMLAHLEQAAVHARGTPLIEQVLFQQGIAYTMLDRFTEAADVYRRGLELPLSNGARGFSLCNLAEIETYLRQPEESIAHYEACVSLIPGYDGGYWGLASALDREGRESEARAAAARALSIDEHARSLTSHGVFYTPPYEQHYYLGLAREAQGRNAEAAQEWRLYLEAGGAHDPWARRAEAHLRALASASAPSAAPTGTRNRPAPRRHAEPESNRPSR
jgi:tetratricopeptide (TPR) repeat protein